jgi:hypothetical protein
MTPQVAISIGKSLGKLLVLENGNASGLICQSYMRMRVEIDVRLPLSPGFRLARPSGDSI